MSSRWPSGCVSFIIWELLHPNPIVNVRLLGDRNFLASGLIIYIAFAVLYGSNVDTPQMLQELFGYDAYHAGLVLSPSAFFTMAMMPIVGFLLGRKVDARWLIPLGLLCLVGASYWQAHLDLYTSPFMFVAPRCVQMMGVGLLFVPLNNAAYLYLPKDQVNNAAGLFNMLRNEGGSLGIAIVTVMVDRRSQFHQLRLAEHVTPLKPGGRSLARLLHPDPHDPWRSNPRDGQPAKSRNARPVGPQSGAEMAYLDIFWIFAIMALLALPLILLMKKSVARGELTAH